MVDALQALADFCLQVDRHLVELSAQLGPWLYVLLFTIVFCETGLVVFPLLPGDSLLFATGALLAIPGSPLDFGTTAVLLFVAAVLGDALNYAIGARLGPAVFTRRSRFLNRRFVERTEQFYARHGKKTVFLARFVGVVRTFAPFLAGVGHMHYREFAAYNVAGGATWVLLFLSAGRHFGQLSIVQDYFELVMLGIIVISLLPVAWELVRVRVASVRTRRPS